MKQYYIYVHCRPNEEPFYIGRGFDYRYKLYPCLRKSNKHHGNVVTKYGKENILIYTRNCESEQQSKDHEIWMIAYGRAQGWNLVNYSDGGEGRSGLVMLPHVKAALLATHLGKVPYNKGKVSPLRGKKRGPMSEEQKKKISISHTGKARKPFTVEHRKNQSIAAKNREILKSKEMGGTGESNADILRHLFSVKNLYSEKVLMLAVKMPARSLASKLGHLKNKKYVHGGCLVNTHKVIIKGVAYYRNGK